MLDIADVSYHLLSIK